MSLPSLCVLATGTVAGTALQDRECGSLVPVFNLQVLVSTILVLQIPQAQPGAWQADGLTLHQILKAPLSPLALVNITRRAGAAWEDLLSPWQAKQQYLSHRETLLDQVGEASDGWLVHHMVQSEIA